MLLTSVLLGFVGQLFPGLEVRGVHQFRVTRNSELFVDDEEIKRTVATQRPYREWLDEYLVHIDDLPAARGLVRELSDVTAVTRESASASSST